jgi:hypothetical protein
LCVNRGGYRAKPILQGRFNGIFLDRLHSFSSLPPTTNNNDTMSKSNSHPQQQQRAVNKQQAQFQEKAKQIRAVLNQQPAVDLWQLRALAISEGGLVNGTIYMDCVASETCVAVLFALRLCVCHSLKSCFFHFLIRMCRFVATAGLAQTGRIAPTNVERSFECRRTQEAIPVGSKHSTRGGTVQSSNTQGD